MYCSGAFSKHVVQVWDFEEDVLPDIRDADHNIITNSAIMVCHIFTVCQVYTAL